MDKQIIIDGVQFGKWGDFYIDYDLDGHFKSITSSAKEYKILKSLIDQLKRKEQECEELETARHLIEISRDKWEYRAKSKERECESLNRWLPIISRLEMAFGSYEKAKAIDFTSYTKQIFAELDQLKTENEELKTKLINWLGKEGLRQSEKEFYEQQLDQLKTDNRILKEKFKIAIKNNTDKTLLRLEKGDVQEELQEIREQFGIETLYFHDDNTRVHRCIKLLQLKDCLTEIREFFNEECIICKENYINITGEICEECKYKDILKKISEVEE